MNILESDLQKQKAKLAAELEDTCIKLENIQNQKLKKRQLKENYRINDVPIKYEVDYKMMCQKFENVIRQFGTLDASTKAITDKYIDDIYRECSKPLPVDRALLYNCPECGEHNSLHIGAYGKDECHMKYAVTCCYCDFVGPKISDYGEAWCEFEDYHVKHGYL